MVKNKVLVFGHSHLGAITSAYKKLPEKSNLEFDLITYQFLRSDRQHIVNINGIWCYHPDILIELKSIISRENPNIVISMLQGEQSISLGMVNPKDPYNFFFPKEENYIQNNNNEIVPFDIIYQTCFDRFLHINTFVKEIRKNLPEQTFSFCPPPPISDDNIILNGVMPHKDLASEISKFGLADSQWRYRIWKVYTMALRDSYASNEIRFIDPPSEAVDSNGCLLNEFCSDIFHANMDYGTLLLNQISNLLAQQELRGTI